MSFVICMNLPSLSKTSTTGKTHDLGMDVHIVIMILLSIVTQDHSDHLPDLGYRQFYLDVFSQQIIFDIEKIWPYLPARVENPRPKEGGPNPWRQ